MPQQELPFLRTDKLRFFGFCLPIYFSTMYFVHKFQKAIYRLNWFQAIYQHMLIEHITPLKNGLCFWTNRRHFRGFALFKKTLNRWMLAGIKIDIGWHEICLLHQPHLAFDAGDILGKLECQSLALRICSWIQYERIHRQKWSCFIFWAGWQGHHSHILFT